MKKTLFILMLLAIAMFGKAQIATNLYWVQFTDKNDSPYSIDVPEQYLSQRALDRRARLAIAIDEYDLPVNPQYLEAVAACGAELVNPSKWLNGVTIHTGDPAVVAAVNALPCVAEVRNCPSFPEAQLDKERSLAMEMKPSDAAPRNTLGLYGDAWVQVSQIKANELHSMGYDGTGIYIAILDGGFIGTETYDCFDNMRQEGRLLGTRDFVYGSTSVYTQSTHGTSCLSTMAAFLPNQFVGTAPKASYYLIHTEDGDGENIVEEYNWVSGMEHADSLGADVCSTSLGYIDFDMTQWNHPFEHFDGHTAPATIGAEIAASRGIICAVAAGNEGAGTCTLGIPADAEHILTVGAVNESGTRASFSSMGPTYDGRVKPDVMALGQGTYVASGWGDWWPYYNGDGTSFATPVLAGAVACLRQALPDVSVQEICDAVRQSGDHAGSPNNYYGYDIPNFARALETLHVEDTFAQKNDLIMVYPNPSQGDVRIAMKEGYQAEITVCDLLGRPLKEYHFNGLNHTTFEGYLNSLSDGVYLIKAESELGSQVVKLIIAK